jgi:hypothetical protein
MSLIEGKLYSFDKEGARNCGGSYRVVVRGRHVNFSPDRFVIATEEEMGAAALAANINLNSDKVNIKNIRPGTPVFSFEKRNLLKAQTVYCFKQLERKTMRDNNPDHIIRVEGIGEGFFASRFMIVPVEGDDLWRVNALEQKSPVKRQGVPVQEEQPFNVGDTVKPLRYVGNYTPRAEVKVVSVFKARGQWRIVGAGHDKRGALAKYFTLIARNFEVKAHEEEAKVENVPGEHFKLRETLGFSKAAEAIAVLGWSKGDIVEVTNVPEAAAQRVAYDLNGVLIGWKFKIAGIKYDAGANKFFIGLENKFGWWSAERFKLVEKADVVGPLPAEVKPDEKEVNKMVEAMKAEADVETPKLKKKTMVDRVVKINEDAYMRFIRLHFPGENAPWTRMGHLLDPKGTYKVVSEGVYDNGTRYVKVTRLDLIQPRAELSRWSTRYFNILVPGQAWAQNLENIEDNNPNPHNNNIIENKEVNKMEPKSEVNLADLIPMVGDAVKSPRSGRMYLIARMRDENTFDMVTSNGELIKGANIDMYPLVALNGRVEHKRKPKVVVGTLVRSKQSKSLYLVKAVNPANSRFTLVKQDGRLHRDDARLDLYEIVEAFGGADAGAKTRV